MQSARPLVFAAAPSPSRTIPTSSVNDFMATRPTTAGRALPPSQSYTVLCKIVLRRRLSRHMSIVVGLAAYVILLFVVFDPTSLPGSLVNFVPVLLFSPFVCLGAIPILVLKKSTLTTTSSSEPSRFSQLLLLFRSSTLRVLLSYFLGSLPILAAYIWCAASVSKDARLGILYVDLDREAHQLNERRIILSLFHLFLILYATVQHVLQSRSRIHFDESTSLPIPVRLGAKIIARAPRVGFSTLLSTAIFYLSYLLLRRLVLRFLVFHIFSNRMRPHLYSILRYNAIFSISLAVRVVASSFLMLAVWEMVHITFEVYATQPIIVSHFSASSNLCLLSGLRSSDDYIRHFAFLELSKISLADPSRRKAIFMELRPEGASGGAWRDISVECLKVIGGELQRAKRGATPAALATNRSTPISKSPSSTSNPSPRTPVRNENIFRPTKKSYLDTIADAALGPSSPPAIVTSSTTALAQTAGHLVSRVTVPAIFQSSSLLNSPSATALDITLPNSKEIPPIEDRISRFIPNRVRGSLYAHVFGKRAEVIVGSYIGRSTEVVWAIQSLANLVCASLHEDPYGVAQGDIPKVLEAFVLYLMELEKLSRTLMASVEGEGQALERADMMNQMELQIESIEGVLKDGVRTIVDEFAPYMSEFRFSPRIAIRLKTLVDWDRKAIR